MRKSIMFIFALILISSVVAAAFPPTPSAFYGTAKYTNRKPIPDGHNVTAELNGVVSGSCTVKDGKYGYGSDTLVVLSLDQKGGTVKFYINGKKANKEAEFVDMGVTELDLTVDSSSSSSDGCWDGYCDINAVECSYCWVDCNVARTNACCGNGQCDSEIGETCSNCETDCGACSTNNNNNNNNGGSNGGSPGGGSPSSGSPSSIDSSDKKSTEDNGDVQRLNGNDKSDSDLGILETETEEGFFSGITSAIIGTFGTAGTIVVLIFIIAIVAIAIVVNVMRKKEKGNG